MPGYNENLNVTPQGSSITIEEQTALGTVGRRLILRGSTMPFKGAQWSTEQNIQTTWYPGNSDDATQQVLGARELPSVWTGEWKRTLMGTTRALYYPSGSTTSEWVINPMTMRAIFESLLREGAPLLVTWRVSGQVVNGQIKSDGTVGSPTQIQNEDWSIVRAGRIKNIVTPIESHTDIAWSIEFHWTGRGGTVARTINVKNEPNLDVRTQDFVDQGSNFAAKKLALSIKKKRLPSGATNLTLGKIEAFGAVPAAKFREARSQMQLQVNDFKRATGVANRIAQQPQSLLASAATFARASANIMSKAHEDISRIPTELLTNKSTPIAVARAHREVNITTDEMITIARTARALNADCSKDSQHASLGAQTPRKNGRNTGSTVLAVHMVRQGDTPTSLSIKFFNTPDRALDILQANKLPWHATAFKVGTILVIPSVRNQQGIVE